MPGPTLLTLRKWTYRRLDENASTRSTDAADASHVENPNYPLSDVDEAINDALQTIPLRLDHDFFKSSATVDAAAAETTLPATYGSRLQLSFRASSTDSWRPLEPITEEEADIRMPSWRTSTVTAPTHFFVKDSGSGTAYYRLVPVLTATVTSGIFQRFSAKVTTLSAKTDTADILEYFPDQRMIYVPCLAASILDLEHDTPRQQTNAALAEQALEKMRQRLKILAAQGSMSYRRR